MSDYVGIDVHRKRSQVAVAGECGKVLANRNVPNGVEPILGVIGGLPPGTPAASGAALGTGWVVELLEGYGFAPHLVHSLRCKAIASARLKNDKVDAAILAQLLRADLLPEAWIAPPPVRQLQALLRHRVALVRLRTLLRNRIHAIVADHGHDRPAGGYWSGPGRAWLACLELPAVSRELAGDDLALISALETVTGRLDWEIRQRGRPRPAGQDAHPAAGRRPIHRTGHPRRDRRCQPVRLGAQAGVLGRAHHRPCAAATASPTTGTSGKQGSVLLRWALCEAAQTAKRSPQFAASFQAIARRRGKKIATTAVARKLLTRAWHLLTDAGHAI